MNGTAHGHQGVVPDRAREVAQREADPGPPLTGRVATSSSSHRPATILVVDDLPPNAVALAAVLKDLDVRVRCAHSGSEALECLLREDFALAVIDVHMPLMDGFQLAEAMRSVARTRYVPIIFVTAATVDPRRAFKGYDSGGVDFLYKPLDAHVIRSKVDAFVQLHRVRTELAERIDQLNEVIRLNDIFTAVLGHDLRNPLGAMLNAAHAMSMLATEPDLRALADRIHRSGGRMARLIEQVLDICRMRTGGFTLTTTHADMRSILDDACADAELTRDDVDIRCTGDSSGVWDADRLTQLFVNLLTNARQHGDDGHRIAVEINGSDTSSVSVSVRNVGRIAPESLHRLFDPFEGSGRDQRHLGLGLFIARQIATSHLGSVAATSQDKTVTFLVTVARIAN